MISFDRKNIGAIYQCSINKILKQQIDHNIELYVDDMLMKNTELDRYIANLKEAFKKLSKYQMKLNSDKYAFRVTSKNFLNFFVT